MKGIERARQAWAQKLRVDSKQRKVHITKRIGTPKAAKKNKANKRCSMQRHKDTIVAYINVLELPSARELRKYSVKSYAVNERRREKFVLD